MPVLCVVILDGPGKFWKLGVASRLVQRDILEITPLLDWSGTIEPLPHNALYKRAIVCHFLFVQAGEIT